MMLLLAASTGIPRQWSHAASCRVAGYQVPLQGDGTTCTYIGGSADLALFAGDLE